MIKQQVISTYKRQRASQAAAGIPLPARIHAGSGKKIQTAGRSDHEDQAAQAVSECRESPSAAQIPAGSWKIFRPDQEAARDPAPGRRPVAAGADQASETLKPARIHAGIHTTITLFEKGKA